MPKIKPFTTEHTWDDPDEAIDFYEQGVGIEFPQPVVDLLYAVADEYPDASFNVQPAFVTNFIAVARPGDRRSWAFIKPERIAIWTAHSRNAEVLRKLHPELLEPANPTRSTRAFVDVRAEDAARQGAMVAIAFASVHARPLEEDAEHRFG